MTRDKLRAKLSDLLGLLSELEEFWAEMAKDRAIAEEQLSPYYDLLIEYDWPDQAKHWQWIATADIEEIVAWATDIRSDEEVNNDMR